MTARPPRKHFPPGRAARMRGAGALTFSRAVVEAPPCSPEGSSSRFTSRNGNGEGAPAREGTCGDVSRWWGRAAGLGSAPGRGGGSWSGKGAQPWGGEWVRQEE